MTIFASDKWDDVYTKFNIDKRIAKSIKNEFKYTHPKLVQVQYSNTIVRFCYLGVLKYDYKFL